MGLEVERSGAGRPTPRGEGAGGQVADAAVRPDVVVVASPAAEHEAQLREAGEDLPVEQFVAKPAVEGLGLGILPRRARFDEEDLGAQLADPLLDSSGDEFRSVVRADVGRHAVLNHH